MTNNEIIRSKTEIPYTWLVQAKRKNWHKWIEQQQTVSGYLLVVGDRYFVYNNAKVNHYGTITINEYIEVDADTIEEAEKALHKISHNSLCETETYKWE